MDPYQENFFDITNFDDHKRIHTKKKVKDPESIFSSWPIFFQDIFKSYIKKRYYKNIIIIITILYEKILITGHFNLLHTGHIRLFQYAKSLGGSLFVAIESDRIAGKNVNESEKDRLNILKIKIIDKAFIYNDSLEKTILKIKPDIVVKGKEFEDKYNPEEKS